MNDYQEMAHSDDCRGYKLRNLRVSAVLDSRTGSEQPDVLAFRVGNGAHSELSREEVAQLHAVLGIWLGIDLAHIEKLEADSELLGRLYAAGVDNWPGHDAAIRADEEEL